jgi:hypothetical protein
MATRKAKPNGQYHLEQEDVLHFMKDQPVKDLPGQYCLQFNSFTAENCHSGWPLKKKIVPTGDIGYANLTVAHRNFPSVFWPLFSVFQYAYGMDLRWIQHKLHLSVT